MAYVVFLASSLPVPLFLRQTLFSRKNFLVPRSWLLWGKEVGSRVGGLAVHFLTLLARPPWAEFLSAGVLGGLRVGLSRERFFVSQGTLFAFRLKSPVLSKRDLTVFVFFAVFGGSGQRDACARI